ncbi:hypothetical protein J8J23_21640, partial [Mycobacterium tuberculosis]|uniref:hypothetical protein n=1 Tax=Mycobacterium tuberculosis TaxID=1773 RepID=UPI001AE0D4AE
AINDFEENPQAGRYHEILANFNDFIELKDYCEQFPNDQNISGVFRLYMKYGYQYLARTIEAGPYPCCETTPAAGDGGWRRG